MLGQVTRTVPDQGGTSMPAFGRRAVSLLWLPVFLSVVTGWSSTAGSATGGPFGKDVVAGWVELGPDAAVIARAITRASSCPALRVDGATQAMAERARPSADFPVLSCEVTLPRHRSEEHTSELQSRQYLVCRLLLEKKK